MGSEEGAFLWMYSFNTGQLLQTKRLHMTVLPSP